MLTLTVPIKFGIKKGNLIVEKNVEGNEVAGKAYGDYDMDVPTIKVRYVMTDFHHSYVQCQVGALLEPNMKGYFAGKMGDLTIDGQEYASTYNAAKDNRGGHTM